MEASKFASREYPCGFVVMAILFLRTVKYGIWEELCTYVQCFGNQPQKKGLSVTKGFCGQNKHQQEGITKSKQLKTARLKF